MSEQRGIRLKPLPDAIELKEAIRKAGHSCGFDQIGFAAAVPSPHTSKYESWLALGYHGEMAYMAREDAVRRRLDPTEALPGCRTIIIASIVYGPAPISEKEMPAHEESAGRRLPIIARYALGRDYHDVIEERLERLAVEVKAQAPGVRTKRYVDYGPVLERDYAQQAGLGWIGKNTMLIDPHLGSYLMLGELLTDLEVPPDNPFLPDHCGTCDRCVVACPTHAILAGRLLDARLCISYLTIELKGSIPENLRPAIGQRVFGCDICQEVCPWNTKASTLPVSPFALEPGQVFPVSDMSAWSEELLELTDESFRHQYAGTALARPGRNGLLRNLAVALGNSGDEAVLPLLRRMVADSSELVREHAQWAIQQLRKTAGSSKTP